MEEEFIQERVGQVLGGRWSLESVLGVGGMAAVYAAKDPDGREAAVKILHPEIGAIAELRERFMREGYVANRIQHPGVVRVLEHGAVDERSVFLVMERLRGESVADRADRQGALPVPQVLDLLDQVLDVLAVAHAAGIIHRDLKPDNLFATQHEGIKVLDFGIARVLEGAPDSVRTRTGMIMGTLSFMAPEQALGKRAEIDGRVDHLRHGGDRLPAPLQPACSRGGQRRHDAGRHGDATCTAVAECGRHGARAGRPHRGLLREQSKKELERRGDREKR